MYSYLSAGTRGGIEMTEWIDWKSKMVLSPEMLALEDFDECHCGNKKLEQDTECDKCWREEMKQIMEESK